MKLFLKGERCFSEKCAVEKRRFGRIYMVNINVFWTRPQSYYESASWRGTWEFDGGAFMNQASHYVDLLDWLIGPVESVQAYTATLARNIQVEDTGVVAVRWRTGALGTMSVTMLTYPKNFEGSITILGEKGTVRIRANSAACSIPRSRSGRRTCPEFEHRDPRHSPIRLAPTDLDCPVCPETRCRVDRHIAVAQHPVRGRQCDAHRFRPPRVHSPGGDPGIPGSRTRYLRR